MKNDDSIPNEQGKELRNHLKDEFQKMQPKEAAPAVLKKQVFDTLDTIRLMADMADLFTVKFTKTESQMMDLLGDEQSDNPTEQPDDEDATDKK